MEPMDIRRVTVVLPSYNPDEKLQKTVASLLAVGFTDLVLVNDGSRANTEQFFPAEDEHITVLRHTVNRGKGAALKTAFQYVLDNRPDSTGVVTVDGDGQHRAEDVRRCAEAMAADGEKIIFGCRDFSLPHVPRRSRMGNRITSAVFRLFCGLQLSDTQTGLRAIPKKLLPLMLTVPGDRFEYETNMLHEMQAHGIGLAEVKIDTVYIEENKTSHFRPFRDSVRVYSRFLLFIASSLASFLLDALLVLLFLTLAEKLFSVHFESEGTAAVAATAACKACARIVSALFNFPLNRLFCPRRGHTVGFIRRDCFWQVAVRARQHLADHAARRSRGLRAVHRQLPHSAGVGVQKRSRKTIIAEDFTDGRKSYEPAKRERRASSAPRARAVRRADAAAAVCTAAGAAAAETGGTGDADGATAPDAATDCPHIAVRTAADEPHAAICGAAAPRKSAARSVRSSSTPRG